MRTAILIIVIGLLTSCATSTTPTVQQGPGAEVTYDGLHRLNDTIVDKVWLKPDIDLSQYDQLMVEGAGIQYRPLKRYSRTGGDGGAFPLTEQQKETLRQAVGEVMLDEISQTKYYAITDQPGRGVLKITLGLIDVVSKIPPERVSARGGMYLTDLGSAILVMELRDSRTNEALARVVDGTRVEPVVLQKSNPVTNIMEVKRSAKRWGNRIRTSLDELHELGCFVCSVQGSIEN